MIVAPLVPSSLGSIRPQRRFDVGRRRRRRRLPASLVFFLRNFPTHSPLTSLSLSGSAIVTGAIRRWWWWTDRKAGGGENSESACLLVFTSLHLGGFQLSTTKMRRRGGSPIFPSSQSSFSSSLLPLALARSHRHHELRQVRLRQRQCCCSVALQVTGYVVFTISAALNSYRSRKREMQEPSIKEFMLNYNMKLDTRKI